MPYTPIEDADISKSTNRFTTNTVYDDAGNVTKDTKFRSRDFKYDANGRMIWTKLADNTGLDATSVYDASGQRVAEKVNDIWRFLIYDVGGKMIAEYGGLPATDEGGVKYLLSDWQGSNRAIVSNSGFVQARMDYQAFGEEINANVGLRTTLQGFGSPTNLRQKYGLTTRDEATGLDHTLFRKNENKAGRWTSPDPYNGSMSLGNPQSFNRYSYVENQPTNFIDPSGLLMITQCTRRWVDLGEGRYYSDWYCQVIYDDGGGFDSGRRGPSDIDGGGGGDEVITRSPEQQKKFEDCLKEPKAILKEKLGLLSDKIFWQQVYEIAAGILVAGSLIVLTIATAGVGAVTATVVYGSLGAGLTTTITGRLDNSNGEYYEHQSILLDYKRALEKCAGENPYDSKRPLTDAEKFVRDLFNGSKPFNPLRR